MITAVILAGGVGSRLGADIPKQFIKVEGKPIIVYTIEIYQQNNQVDNVEVVCHKDYIDYLKTLVIQYGLSKVKWIVAGGKDFQESCLKGIYSLEDKISRDDILMIHYADAPFTSQKMIDDCIKVCREKGNAVCGIPCFQLMGTRDKNTDGSERSTTWIDRDKYIQISCPYAFKYGFVLDVYREAEDKKLLDKVEPHVTTLMQYMGYSLNLSYGDQTNLKITTKDDLKLFTGFVLAKIK